VKPAREYLRLAPSESGYQAAVRRAIGIGLPLLTLLAIGRVDLSIFAVLGALTAVYGRGREHHERLTRQAYGGALLLLAVFAGSVTSQLAPPRGVVVAATAMAAGLGFVAASLRRLRPAGSLFYVYAFSAVAFMSPAAPFWQGLLTTTAAIALSIFIGMASRVVPSRRTAWEAKPHEPVTADDRRDIYREAWLHVVSVGLAGSIALWLGFGHSYWAMIAATVPLVGVNAAHQIERGFQRVIGTFGGLVIAGVLLGVITRDWQLVAAAIVLQFFAELFILRNYGLGLVFVTPLALVMSEVMRPASQWMLMRDRAVETIVGAGVGVLLVLAVQRIREWRRAEAGPVGS
jgi:uncharacterized membrane protein YccC